MFSLRKWLTLLTTLLLILFVTQQLWQIYKRHRRGSANWYVFTAVTAVAALTLLIDDVSLWCDNFTGLNNFSWYLGYSLGILSAASAGLVDCQMGKGGRDTKRVRMLVGLTICVLLLMAFVYGVYMLDSAEWVARDPRSWYEVVFSGSFFLYNVSLTLITMQIARQAMPLERNPMVRLRLQIGNLCRYIAILCFVTKLSYIVLEFTVGGYRWLNQLAVIAMVIAALLWLTVVMPKRFYEWLMRRNPWTHYQHRRLLRDLESLQAQVTAIIPLAESYRYQNEPLLRADLQMILYQVIIQILDGKKILDGYLTATSEERQQYPEIAWSHEQWLTATAMHQALSPLNQLTDDSIQEVAHALQIVARNLRSK